MNIIYLLPSEKKPTGGIKVILDHSQIINNTKNTKIHNRVQVTNEKIRIINEMLTNLEQLKQHNKNEENKLQYNINLHKKKQQIKREKERNVYIKRRNKKKT